MSRDFSWFRSSQNLTSNPLPQTQVDDSLDSSKKKKKKSRVKELIEEREAIIKKNMEENNKERIFIRDRVEQGIVELKTKKMNGEIFTATIGDILKAKQEEMRNNERKQKET